MRQAIKKTLTFLKRKLKSNSILRRETFALIRWLKSYPAYIAASALIVSVALIGWNRMSVEWRQVEDLRLALSAQSKLYEDKIERKKQRLAAALSHLENNPVLKAPSNQQSLIGPFVKMEWEYSTKDNSARQYSHEHSMVEIRSAETPLQSQTILVTGDTAWYPISLLKKLDKQGKYLWRVIPASIDLAGKQIAEGNWGPFSVFSIYPNAYERIKSTRQIMIGAYSVEQLELIGPNSEPSCLKAHFGLSDPESKLICSVVDSISKANATEITVEVKPVVKQYSDIDNVLIPALKAGELDIAFGNISRASYREKNGLMFLEYYDKSEPVLLTNIKVKAGANEIGKDDAICTFKGTVYQRVANNIMEKEKNKKEKNRYQFTECQNTYDAMDKLKRNEISWVFMDKRTWEGIKNSETSETFELYQNEQSEVLKSVQNELKGDALVMTDKTLRNAICLAIRAIREKEHRDDIPQCDLLL